MNTPVFTFLPRRHITLSFLHMYNDQWILLIHIFSVSGSFSVLPIFFSSHLCHPVRSTRLVYVHAIVSCPLISGLLPFLGISVSRSSCITVDLLNVFGVSLEVSKLAVSTVLDGCCLGLCRNLK